MNGANFFDRVIILENDRASLTPLIESDFEKLEPIAYHPEIWRVGMSNLIGPAQLKAYIQTALKERERYQSYPFLIFDKKNNEVAGSTRFGNISFENKRLEIGWTWLHPDYQGTGLNKSCKFLLLQFAFETLGFNRVEIKTDAINQQSRKAILKIGAKEEGIFRKHQITSEGRVRDSAYYSIINDEWPFIKSTVFNDF
ncbi:MAG: GNAT family N-acetyltransferase [Ferruginibacter sp.]|nr:GNAT family N-acetyltransferase [Ferruginibacter sp.]